MGIYALLPLKQCCRNKSKSYLTELVADANFAFVNSRCHFQQQLMSFVIYTYSNRDQGANLRFGCTLVTRYWGGGGGGGVGGTRHFFILTLHVYNFKNIGRRGHVLPSATRSLSKRV